MSELKAFDVIINEDYKTKCYMKADSDKVIAHQKYKRCLAMAKWCRSIWSAIIFIHEGHGAEHYMKWENRWLKLAEQFKEAK